MKTDGNPPEYDPRDQEYQPSRRGRLSGVWGLSRRNRAAAAGLLIIAVLALAAVFGRFVLPYNPYYGEMSQNFRPPSALHWFGTDELGRDIFSRVVEGAHITMGVGLSAVLIALTAGVVLGAAAGYYGRWADTVIMRFMDMMLAIPDILLAIAIMSVLGPGVGKAVAAIGLVTIPQYARVARGSVLSAKENDYVAAARAVGNSDFRILAFHILPNIVSPLIVRSALGISSAILDAAALGFLGLGAPPPLAEWGTMLGSGRDYILSAPYILIFPGLAVTVCALAFNLLGDGLQSALDPRNRR